MGINKGDFSLGDFGGWLNLLEWSCLVNEGRWKPREFDLLVIKLLEYALQGKVSNILLSIPSRHGKSTLISKNFCSYFLSYFPNDKVILSCYSQGLASEFGGQVKDIVNHYSKDWSPYGLELSKDSHAKHRFKIQGYEGQMLALGASGSIMGFGAGLFIIDDPIKNVADADSVVKQRKLKEWFNGVVRSRLERRNDGKPPIMCVIAQRLHINDLHGIIMDSSNIIPAETAFLMLERGESIPQKDWVYLNLPAVWNHDHEDLLGRKKGEVLWEEQRDYEWLMNEKKEIGSYLFNSIYQGNPVEREGNIFKRSWFMDTKSNKIYNQINPEDVADAPTLRYWDFGASGSKGDATASVKTAWTGDKLIILDLIHGKYTANQVLRVFKKTANKDGTKTIIRIEQEPASASKILLNQLRKDLKKHNIRGDKVNRKKTIRSFDLEALAESGRVYFLKADWNIKIIDELVSFTGEDGRADDIVDACTGSARFWRRPRKKINI